MENTAAARGTMPEFCRNLFWFCGRCSPSCLHFPGRYLKSCTCYLAPTTSNCFTTNKNWHTAKCCNSTILTHTQYARPLILQISDLDPFGMKIYNSSGKRRCLCFVLSLALLVVCANIGITALLLLHVNVTQVGRIYSHLKETLTRAGANKVTHTYLFQPSVGNIYFGSDRTLVDGHLLVPKSLSTSMLRSGRDPLRLFGEAQLSMAAMPVDNEEGSFIDIDGDRTI